MRHKGSDKLFSKKDDEPAIKNESYIEKIANKDMEQYKEVREIIIDLIINSDDKEFKEQMLKVYDYINKPRVYNL